MRLIIYFLIFSINGCAYSPHIGHVNRLKELGESQKEIKQYVEKKENLFSVLIDDIKNKKLKLGIPKKEIIRVYGEAVLTKKIDNNISASEVLLYRHPVDYFSPDKAYLYFDEAGQLSHWKYKSPHQPK